MLRMVKLIFVVISVLILKSDPSYCFVQDSIPTLKNFKIKKSESIRISLSTSYIIQKNWGLQDLNSFLMMNSFDILLKKSSPSFDQTWRFKSDLGFLQVVDSTWNKYIDYWKINWRYNEITSRTLTHVYSFDLSSQWLDTRRYIRKPDDKGVRQWRGGVFNPATLLIAYNINMNFWEYSNMMVGLTSIQLTTKPRYIGAKEPIVKSFAQTRHSWVLLNYGLSLQAFIYSKKIGDNVIWDNTSTAFVNGVSKDQVNFNFQNRITVKFLKYFQFRVDTHIIYDPLYSYQLQFDQEFLIGIFYEKRKIH